MKRISTSVRAQVTVDIVVGRWGGDGNLAALHEQASREALQTIRNRLSGVGLQIVGEPTLQFVTHQED